MVCIKKVGNLKIHLVNSFSLLFLTSFYNQLYVITQLTIEVLPQQAYRHTIAYILPQKYKKKIFHFQKFDKSLRYFEGASFSVFYKLVISSGCTYLLTLVRVPTS